MTKRVVAFTIQSNGNMYYGLTKCGLSNIYQTLDCSAIEAVRLEKAVMYIDEEGKFKTEPQLNKVATIIAWMNGLSTNDWIAGNAVIFGTVSPKGEVDGDDHDCPDYLHDLFIKFTEVDYNMLDGFMSALRKMAS